MLVLTELLYELKNRSFYEHDIRITRVNNTICFSEESKQSPRTFYKIKVLITLNQLPFSEKTRLVRNLREDTSIELKSIIVNGIFENDTSFIKRMHLSGYRFQHKIDSKFNLRLRHILLSNEPLTKEKFKRLYPIVDEIEKEAKKDFSDYEVRITGSGKRNTSTYLDLYVNK